ncbi:sensor histidine kinase [Cohnella nanjingensis]|nr:HAMP domain-containing sensor histidine kinase [Cohnella nanjingensis]
MSKYILLLLFALVIWPTFPAGYYFLYLWTHPNSFYETEKLDAMWKAEAITLNGASASLIHEKLMGIHGRYPEARLFWVDASGHTQFVEKRPADIPAQWSYRESVAFDANIKEDKETYTVTALIGGSPEQGWMVFQMPTRHTDLSMVPFFGDARLAILFSMACGGIVVVSLLFFLRLRRRLIRLKKAMADTGTSGVPREVAVRNRDEIGELERSFNEMVDQLRRSREREREEESLRSQFIASISHDLRTPLTVIRQHAYVVQKNPASPQGISSMEVIVNKLGDVGKLIDNLLSHTLLAAGKYPLKTKDVHVIEEVRNAVAEWYPLFEQEGFEIDVNLPEDKALVWHVDPLWLRSMLDNLFQNVVRHAKSGGYVGVHVAERNGWTCLEISDKGLGLERPSSAKGAGIGLSIVALMAKNMNLHWEIASSSAGTRIYIGKPI